MSVQVLVATMNQKDHSLLTKMNIQSDVIVGNQCDSDGIEVFEFNGHTAEYLNFNEKGVGLNRNNALMRASADYCLFADDDMFFYDGYSQIVEDLFAKNPMADILILNIDEKGKSDRRKSEKVKKVHLFNYMNYGAARIAIRRKSVSYAGVAYNLNFGGGTQHSCGEDTLFLHDCLKSKLKMYTVPVAVACLEDNRESSWFKGYTEKYFFDKGVLLQIAHPNLSKLFAVYFVIRHKEYTLNNGMTKKRVLKNIKKGIAFVKDGYKEAE